MTFFKYISPFHWLSWQELSIILNSTVVCSSTPTNYQQTRACQYVSVYGSQHPLFYQQLLSDWASTETQILHLSLYTRLRSGSQYKIRYLSLTLNGIKCPQLLVFLRYYGAILADSRTDVVRRTTATSSIRSLAKVSSVRKCKKSFQIRNKSTQIKV